MEAVSSGSVETVRALLENKNVDCNLQDNAGRTTLTIAVESEDARDVQEIITLMTSKSYSCILKAHITNIIIRIQKFGTQSSAFCA